MLLGTPGFAFLGLAIPGLRRRKTWRRKLMFFGFLLMLTALVVGCGGNGFFNPNNLTPGSGGTQPGTYVVEVTGTYTYTDSLGNTQTVTNDIGTITVNVSAF
jgi:ABC-type Fe3+-hydroxamate transport system substrate-binding protein